MKTIKSLLLVDDDEIFAFLTKLTIEKTNLVDKIKVFHSGIDAMRFLEENQNKPDLLPDMIFLDINMPHMDGWEFLEEYLLLKPKIGKRIFIYVISSSISPYDQEKANKITEVTDYVVKPLTKTKFIELMKKLEF